MTLCVFGLPAGKSGGLQLRPPATVTVDNCVIMGKKSLNLKHCPYL